MTKDEWKNAYETLNALHTQFIDLYDKSLVVNKKEKEAILRRAQNSIDKALSQIQSNPDIFNLIAKGTEFEKKLSLDDFTDIRHFDGALLKLLKLIKEEIISQ